MWAKLSTACLGVFLLFASLNAFADKGHLYLSAKVAPGIKASDKISVRVTSKGLPVMSFNTKPDGNISMFLDLQSSYEIRCALAGFHDGVVKVSTLLPAESESGKYEFFAELPLIPLSGQAPASIVIRFIREANRFDLVTQPKQENKVASRSSSASTPEMTSKNSIADHVVLQKQKQEEQKKNQSIKAEANTELIRAMADGARKDKGPEQEFKQEEDKYKKVTIIVVSENNIKNRYRKVEYRWGSSYFYKNGEQIPEKQWLRETAQVRAKQEDKK